MKIKVPVLFLLIFSINYFCYSNSDSTINKIEIFEKEYNKAINYLNNKEQETGINSFRGAISIAEHQYPNDTVLFYYYHSILYFYYSIISINLSKEYLDKAFSLCDILKLNNANYYFIKTKLFEAKYLIRFLQYNDAKTILEEQIKIIDFKNLDNFSLIVDIYSTLWKLYEKIGSFAEAEETLLQLNKYTSVNCNKPYSWGCHLVHYCYLGELYQALGRYSEAENVYRYCLENADDISNNRYTPLLDLGGLHRTIGKYEESEHYLMLAIKCLLRNPAIELKEVLNLDIKSHTELGRVLNSLSKLFVLTGRYEEAEKTLKYSIQLREDSRFTQRFEYGRSLVSLAKLYIYTGNYEQADSLLNLAYIATKNDIGEYNDDFFDIIRYNAILNYQNNKPELALENFQNLINYDLYVINSTLFSQAEIHRKKLIEKLYSDFEIFYSYVLKYYNELPEIKNILYDYILAIKGIQFKSAKKLNESINNSNDTSLINKYKNWKLLREYAVKMRTKPDTELKTKKIACDSIDELVIQLEREITRASDLFAKGYKEESCSWKQIQEKLLPKDAAIEIIRVNLFNLKPNSYNPTQNILDFTDSIMYIALIITKDNSVDLVLFANGNELENKYYNDYSNAMSDYRVNPKSNEFYKQFWEPIEKKLKGIKNIYISNDGIYHKINLNTIYNPFKKKYLVDYLNIKTVSGTKELLKYGKSKEKQKKITNGTVTIFGNPDFDLNFEAYQEQLEKYSDLVALRGLDSTINPDRFYPLLYSEKEAIEISNLFKKQKWETNLYIGKNALEELVKSQKSPTVLHFATHSLYINENKQKSSSFLFGNDDNVIENNPLLRSMLLFAGSKNTLKKQPHFYQNTDDGLLTAYEALNIDLENTELVVLSACETGIGNIESGQGVYCLQSSFQTAGAKSVIMSLWKIPDEATKDFMKLFYTLWLSGKEKITAFKLAQNKIREEYSHPFFWGGLVFVN